MLLFVNMLLFGCSSEIDNKPAAEIKEISKPVEEAKTPVSNTEKAPVTADTQVASTQWKIKEGSTLGFVGAKVSGDHTGGFKGIDGAVSVADNAVVAVELTIDMGTLFADHPKLEGHLKTEDFFNVVEYPTATFKSTAIQDGKITGVLDLVGQSKEVTFPATVEIKDAMALISGEFTINRQVWGIAYPGKPDDLIKDEVLIKANMSFGM